MSSRLCVLVLAITVLATPTARADETASYPYRAAVLLGNTYPAPGVPTKIRFVDSRALGKVAAVVCQDLNGDAFYCDEEDKKQFICAASGTTVTLSGFIPQKMLVQVDAVGVGSPQHGLCPDAIATTGTFTITFRT